MDYSEILRGHGLKITKPRTAILDVLHRNDHGLDAEQIRSLVEEDSLYIDLSTVYRTLDTFVSKGIVSKFDLGDKKYNYKIKHHNHSHKIECEVCGDSFELDCPMNMVEEMISKETGFYLTNHRIEFKGVCKNCQEAEENEEDSEGDR